MITINDLGLSFDGRRVLEGITLEVPDRESLVLLGKNGTGKSVFLKVVCGLLGHYTGSVQIDGVDIKEFFSERERRVRKHGAVSMAYVFQKGGLFDSMNVFDNVAFGLRRRGVDENTVDEEVRRSLARVGLAGNENKLPSELSGGMQKRVGIARAVCMKPDIILFDDPTAGLDPILSDSIADLLLEIRNDLHATSIIVTHDLKMAEKVADRIALLYGGGIVFRGSREEFFSESDSYARQFIQGEIEGPIDIF